ncbi:MAG: diheme cytochrome c [Gammaproteobacteria bacterium]|nr:diheme cytochrome c [Gammaproteobacteria bacterium]MBU1654284.1 diheme cytochrome c [Gammaproteobacteria bacterium]MBU1960633.1 diheme cytochrome c [Gammaproteobacteria bacterium]
MKKTLLAMTLVLGSLGTVHWATADEGEREHGLLSLLGYGQDVDPVANATYKEECGSCHFAYQPGLLPERSWQGIMTGLKDHFGDNAELEQPVRDQISQYLVANAADHSATGRSPGIAKALTTEGAPLRITETAYFRRKHHEVPERMVKENPQVKSFSQCQTCHTKAESGSFDEHQVEIPGFGGRHH